MPHTVINKRWFDGQLAAREISQRKLAKMMDMDPSALSLMLSGKRKMTAAEASDVARLLGVSVEEVLRHAGIGVPSNMEKSVPVVGYIGERGLVRLGRVKGPQTAIAPPECKGCHALRVQNAGIMEGWLLFYRPADGVSLESVGRLCIVQLVEDDHQYALFVARGYEAGYYVLSDGQSGETQHVRLEKSAPVLWMKQ